MFLSLPLYQSHLGVLSFFISFTNPARPGRAGRCCRRVRLAVAVVLQSCAVENATILSTAEEPSRVTCGSSVTSSLLQEGVTVDRGCIVSDSLLMEHSHVDNHGKVREEREKQLQLSCREMLGSSSLVFCPEDGAWTRAKNSAISSTRRSQAVACIIAVFAEGKISWIHSKYE